MDDNVIKNALDSFEDDDFLGAKEILQPELRKAKNIFLKNKLGLTKDIEDVVIKPVEPVAPVIPPEEKKLKTLVRNRVKK